MKTDYVDIQTEGEGMTSFYSEQELKELGLAQIGSLIFGPVVRGAIVGHGILYGVILRARCKAYHDPVRSLP